MARPNCLATAPGIVAAEVTINGLALLCFNQQDPDNNMFWEVAYIRHPKHTLLLSIEQVNSQTGEVTNIRMTEIDDIFLRNLDIHLSTGTNDLYTGFPNGGCHPGSFNRLNGVNNPNDLRWMIDVAGTEPRHGGFGGLKPPGSLRFHVTLATFHHSLFFSSGPSNVPVLFTPRDSDPLDSTAFVLGRTNKQMCALMMAPAAGQIIFDGIDQDPLTFNDHISYRIYLINADNFGSEHWPAGVINNHVTFPELAKGDFHLFYEVINVGGQQKELWAAAETLPVGVPDGGSNLSTISTNKLPFVAPDGDCNPAFASVATLQPLIE